MRMTRRAVMASTLATTLTRPAWAQPRPIRLIRRDVFTPLGQADLAKYARAVGIMSRLPAKDPRSWTYQWYIHSIPDDRTKEDELKRNYGVSGPGLALAQETWSTCQSHFPGMDSDNFLPWHRMYLMCFETTIRSILNDPSFALPYWNYLDASQRVLPSTFRDPGHPDFGVLYRPDRNGPVNAGQAIDGGNPTMINPAALLSPSYRAAGVHPGFCAHIDGYLHGTIHVRIGNRRGMGNVPWAANDPIFWLHHANIDRLWASWNANGGRNPQDAAWLARTFVFPNGTGGRASMECGKVTTLQGAGYSYDRLEPGPAIVVPSAGAAKRPVVVLDAASAAITVPSAGTQIKLRKRNRPSVISVSGARLFIVLSDLAAPDTPGVVYRVEMRGGRKTWTPIGHINFFDSVLRVGDEHRGHTAPRSFAFDVTDIAAGMKGSPEVRIVPEGAPYENISVTIGRVEFVQN